MWTETQKKTLLYTLLLLSAVVSTPLDSRADRFLLHRGNLPPPRFPYNELETLPPTRSSGTPVTTLFDLLSVILSTIPSGSRGTWKGFLSTSRTNILLVVLVPTLVISFFRLFLIQSPSPESNSGHPCKTLQRTHTTVMDNLALPFDDDFHEAVLSVPGNFSLPLSPSDYLSSVI